MPKKPPSYRKRPGYTQAIVTLTDSVTKKRRDFWLGECDSPESRERYHRAIAEWERLGRCLPDPDFDRPVDQRKGTRHRSYERLTYAPVQSVPCRLGPLADASGG